MKILIIDNYDSFTYNLVQLVEQIVEGSVDVFKNDEISVEQIGNYDKIILSPGPGVPSEAGILLDVIKKYASFKPILGVCLGHQAIAEAFGGNLVNLSQIFHGVGESIKIISENARIFKDLPHNIKVGRYHSWVVSSENFPKDLEITAVDKQGVIMALQHKEWDIHAVQFHPESILTSNGRKILENFLK